MLNLCVLYKNSGFFKGACFDGTTIDFFKEFEKETLMNRVGAFMKPTPEPCKV
jgi:hypothetical protein